MYPYHGWLIKANGPPNSPLRYTMWVAFEHPPKDVVVPLKMITEWPNAYLQSTGMEGFDNEVETTETPPATTGTTECPKCECGTDAETETPSSRSLKRDSKDFLHQVTLSVGGLLLAAGGFLLGN